MSDHTALQQRLDDPSSHGYLRIEKEYRLSKPLRVMSNRTVEFGPLGRLTANADFNGVGLLQMGTSEDTADRVRIISPILNGNKAQTQQPGRPGFCGIYAWGGSFCDIIDGSIFDMPVKHDDPPGVISTGDGIYLGRNAPCVYWNIRGVSMVGCGRNGISVINAKYLSITECHVRSSGMTGIDIEPNSAGESMWGVRIVNNTFRTSKEDGVRIATMNTQDKRPVIIVGNTIDENGGKGIWQVDGGIEVIQYANVIQLNAGG